MREAPSAGYELLPRWELAADGDDWQIVDQVGKLITLPDHVERLATRRIKPLGRRDAAVKVGGYNVWPQRVADILRSTDGVTDVAVRLGSQGRLKAFVVNGENFDAIELRAELERLADSRLTPLERPVSYSFGAALPRNGMGKPSDWN